MMMISRKVSVGAATFAVLLLIAQPCSSFQTPHTALETGRSVGVATFLSSSVAEEPSSEISVDPEVIQLKDDLIAIAAATRRGFSASRSDRDKAKKIISNLAKCSPSDQPAAAYYKESNGNSNMYRSTIAGKWTLIYTDAPDITSLEGGPLSTAKLGRIGQECNPPSIKNVIEWQRPDWASSLPFSGGESSRVLQRVCCEGSATQDNPKTVDLKLVGFELSGLNGSDDVVSGDSSGLNSLFNGPAALLESNPVKLQGPLAAPFGKFDILYLDANMRITKTYQGYFAVNIREENEWF
mmetsp:Transcript_33007/g.69471  ORF Transcript_33007/g.69471 Transcript_33007/m.69471 type:complete len:296 (+) Transcript_33007:97-984(+)